MFYPENEFYKKSILLKRILKNKIIGNKMQCIISGRRNVSKIISLQVLKINKIHSTKKTHFYFWKRSNIFKLMDEYQQSKILI